MSWRGRLDSLLYDGETITAEFAVDGSEIVVTSHRVLSFAPDADGKPFRQVDRPNVAGARTELHGRTQALLWATGAGVLGTALAFVSLAIDFAAPVESAVDPADVPGAGEAVGAIAAALSIFDLVVLLGGLLACLASLVLFGLYLHSRERVLVLAVYGEPDVEIPVTRGADDVAPALSAAVEPGAEAETGAEAGDGRTGERRTGERAETGSRDGADPRGGTEQF